MNAAADAKRGTSQSRHIGLDNEVKHSVSLGMRRVRPEQNISAAEIALTVDRFVRRFLQIAGVAVPRATL